MIYQNAKLVFSCLLQQIKYDICQTQSAVIRMLMNQCHEISIEGLWTMVSDEEIHNSIIAAIISIRGLVLLIPSMYQPLTWHSLKFFSIKTNWPNDCFPCSFIRTHLFLYLSFSQKWISFCTLVNFRFRPNRSCVVMFILLL